MAPGFGITGLSPIGLGTSSFSDYSGYMPSSFGMPAMSGYGSGYGNSIFGNGFGMGGYGMMNGLMEYQMYMSQLENQIGRAHV